MNNIFYIKKPYNINIINFIKKIIAYLILIFNFG